MHKKYHEYIKIDTESSEVPLLPIENLGIQDQMEQSGQNVASVPVRPVTNSFTYDMKKLTRGFCKLFLKFRKSNLFVGMDQFGFSIKKGTNRDLLEEGIFVEKNSRGTAMAGDIRKYDQLVKITWKKASQNSTMQEFALEHSDSIQQIAQRVSRIPINIVCTIHYRR